jgi:hypothetical protein
MEQLATNNTVTTALLEMVPALRWQDGPSDLALLINCSGPFASSCASRRSKGTMAALSGCRAMVSWPSIVALA